jgi:hypothetical protein
MSEVEVKQDPRMPWHQVIEGFPAPFIGAPALISIQKRAKFIHAVSIGGKPPRMYFFVPDVDEPMEDRQFAVVRDGEIFHKDARYCGSYTYGNELWHIIDETKVPDDE